MQNFHRMVEDIQSNCDITDARHARNMTMCMYLLEMRQYYRWEHDIPFSENPPKSELGKWLVSREQHWDAVEDASYVPIRIGEEEKEPFDADAINRLLLPKGYVYSAGVGRFSKPHFFLGKLIRKEERDGFTILVSGCEYARDLIAPPAALQNRTIYLRREAVKRMIWEKFEEWRWSKRGNSQPGAFSCYDFGADPDAALEMMADAEGEAMILHELGEGMAGDLLGEAWEEMLSKISSRRMEIIARAMRDHLADCLSTLPRLIEADARCSLDFYFINFEGMRRALFPSLLTAYRSFRETGSIKPLNEAARLGREHWLAKARMMLDVFERGGELEEACAEDRLAL